MDLVPVKTPLVEEIAPVEATQIDWRLSVFGLLRPPWFEVALQHHVRWLQCYVYRLQWDAIALQCYVHRLQWDAIALQCYVYRLQWDAIALQCYVHRLQWDAIALQCSSVKFSCASH